MNGGKNISKTKQIAVKKLVKSVTHLSFVLLVVSSTKL